MLQVTPQITADGTVFMDVTVENTQIDNGIARINGTPALDTQSTETKVLINDGGTVVHWRRSGQQPGYKHQSGTSSGQRAADRQPIQTHFGHRIVPGTALLCDAPDSAGLGPAKGVEYQVTREEASVSSLLYMETLPWKQ